MISGKKRTPKSTRVIVRGYRVYQDLWKPSIREKLVAKREFNNPMEKHAVKVVKGDETVGHLSHNSPK